MAGVLWTASELADVLGGFLAFGLLHLRGVEGQAGWRWLFLIEVQPLTFKGNRLLTSETGTPYSRRRPLGLRSHAIVPYSNCWLLPGFSWLVHSPGGKDYGQPHHPRRR